MREIVLDTETTGIEPAKGHRLIEIGCVEVINHIPTGRTYHQYINPERDVPAEAVAVHGITDDFLADKPVFSQVYADFLDFIGTDRLVIHNAAFDMKFLNAELSMVGHQKLPMSRAFDTLLAAREKFPGSPASLDALCRRFGIDSFDRDLHGALLDARILAEVYLELMGGRQQGLALGAGKGAEEKTAQTPAVSAQAARERVFHAPRPHEPAAEEKEAHTALLDKIKDPLWRGRGAS